MDWETINRRYVRPALAASTAGQRQDTEALFSEGLNATGNDEFVALHFAEFLEKGARFDEAREHYRLAVNRLPMTEWKRPANEQASSAKNLADVDRATPIQRMSVFLFIDGVLVERNLDGYVPYQWILDPQEVGPGEHVVTGLLAWSEDHYGVKHVRIQIGK